jgi:hypothetical protein
MYQSFLHDVAKFLSGLVLADLFLFWWLGTHKYLLPVHFLGLTFTSGAILPGMIFDTALFIFLIYYGWHLGKMPGIRERTYLLIAGIFFGIITIAHAISILGGSSVVYLGWYLPVWLSWIATVAAAFLSYMSFHLLFMRRM